MRTVIGILVCALIIILFLGCNYELQPTGDQKIKDEIKRMKIIEEHRMLQLKIIQIDRAIGQIRAERERKMPTFNLAPVPEPNSPK